MILWRMTYLLLFELCDGVLVSLGGGGTKYYLRVKPPTPLSDLFGNRIGSFVLRPKTLVINGTTGHRTSLPAAMTAVPVFCTPQTNCVAAVHIMYTWYRPSHWRDQR